MFSEHILKVYFFLKYYSQIVHVFWTYSQKFPNFANIITKLNFPSFMNGYSQVFKQIQKVSLFFFNKFQCFLNIFKSLHVFWKVNIFRKFSAAPPSLFLRGFILMLYHLPLPNGYETRTHNSPPRPCIARKLLHPLAPTP